MPMQQIKGYDVTKKSTYPLPTPSPRGGLVGNSKKKKKNKQPLTLLINQLPKAN